jgi:hypothetical protein
MKQKKKIYTPYNLSLGHYHLKDPKQYMQEVNSMLEYRFPQGQFRRHDAFGLVKKHCELISLSWTYSHGKWQNELPFQNAIEWEDVQARPKSPNFVTLYTMTPKDQMEEINRKLAKIERTRKEEEHKQ